MKKYLIGAVITLLLLLGISLSALNNSQKERQRMAANQRGLLEDISYYRTKDSLSSASVERLELTKKEFENYRQKLEKEIEQMGVRIRRLQSTTTTVTETRVEVKTVVRDSIVRGDTVRCVTFQDPWTLLDGCVFGNEFQGLIQTKDTLVQVVHRVPKEFWFIKYGTKAIRQEITSKNPYSEIVYSEYIEIKR